MCKSSSLLAFSCLLSDFVFSLGLSACVSEDDAEDTSTVRQSVQAQPCEPGEGFDDCFSWDFVAQNVPSVIDPSYPGRDAIDEGDNRFDVTMAVDDSVGGIIPVAANQGRYNTSREFIDRFALVMGIDPVTIVSDEISGSLTQVGVSKKYNPDLELGALDVAASGDVICDAMTDENGKFWIKGVEVDAGCGEFDFNYEFAEESNSSFQIIDQSLTFRAGNEKADMEPYKRNYYLFKFTGTRIKNYYRDGKKSRWQRKCRWGWFGLGCFWRKRSVKTKMQIINVYHYKDKNNTIHRMHSRGKSSNNADNLSLIDFGLKFFYKSGEGPGTDDPYDPDYPYDPQIDEPFVANMVCGEGTAGKVRGHMYSTSSCKSQIP